MQISREKVVEYALSFIDTPWAHGARVKHVGIDCTGLIICSFNEAGASIPDMFEYSLFDEFPALVRALHKFCIKKQTNILPADILLFRGKDMFNHVGIAIDSERFIHAYSAPAIMKVVVQKNDAYWKQRLKGIYSFKDFK